MTISNDLTVGGHGGLARGEGIIMMLTAVTTALGFQGIHFSDLSPPKKNVCSVPV